jgi:hypothetical protein
MSETLNETRSLAHDLSGLGKEKYKERCDTDPSIKRPRPVE